MDAFHTRAFATPSEFANWLAKHHAHESEIWLKIHKKSSGVASVTWAEAVIEALAWGWIDGVKKAYDENSWLQRFTPRKKKSNWSTRNREHAERLIDTGRMQLPGLVHVEAARRDGRWEQAYAGSADMVMPAAFLAALKKNGKAMTFYATMGRASQFTIYYRLQTAKSPTALSKRVTAILAQLTRGKIP